MRISDWSSDVCSSDLAVIDGGIELCESVAGVSAADAADAARAAGSAQMRTIPVTIEGERRIMRVVDVPLTPEGGRVIGVAGYAIDIQELEKIGRASWWERVWQYV